MSCCRRIFAGLFGAFLGLALLKFGNPPITEKWVTAPAGFWEFLLGYPWPIAWAYWLLALVGVAGIAVARWKSAAPRWLVALPAGLAGLAVHCRHAVGGCRAHQAHSQAFRRLRPLLLPRLFLAEPGAAGLAVLARFAVRFPAGPGSRLGAAVRRPEGVAPLLLPLRLSLHEGSAAGVSEEDLQQPHLLDALLPQRPGRGAAAAAASHPGGAVATARAPDTRRPVVPDGVGRDGRAGLPLLVRVEGRLAVDAVARAWWRCCGCLSAGGSRSPW